MNCLCVILCFISSIWAEESKKTSLIYDDIAPLGYDHLSSPRIDDEAVTVNITITNLNIRSVDESDMSLTVAAELWQSWEDMRLQLPAWSTKKYQILDSEWVRKIWTPNVYFVNAVDGKMNNIITPSSFFWLTPMKRVIFCCRMMLRLSCEMDLERFPHDEQRCGIKMASAIFSDVEVRLQWSQYRKMTKKHSGLQQFEIVDLENNVCGVKLGSVNFSCLEETIVFRRRSGYYLINVYIPTVLIVQMSMLTFWIPPDAVPARVTLGVTSLLTIITKQYQASLPNVSYIVALNVWLSCCIAFVFFSLLEYTAVIAISTRQLKSNSVFSVHPDIVMPMLLLKVDGTWSTKKPWSQYKESKWELNPKKLDVISRFLFPTFFLVFCITYWQYYSHI